MGATNPKDAKAGTIRADFAASIDENAVHGSDSKETAKEEIAFFFDRFEILAPRGATSNMGGCGNSSCGCSNN